MTAEEALEVIRDRIVAACDPEEIILFGSHARGDAGPDSDLDLLVVMEQVADNRAARIAIGKRLRGIPFPTDIFVAESSELAEGDSNGVMASIVREGRSLYRVSKDHVDAA